MAHLSRGNTQQELAGTLTKPEKELQLLEQLPNMRDRWGWVKTSNGFPVVFHLNRDEQKGTGVLTHYHLWVLSKNH